MANEEQLAILARGVEVWNAWREENPNTIFDLSSANLRGIYFRNANLSKVNFYQANLNDSNFTSANLREANLYGAYLHGTDFSESDLSEANLSRAYLSQARLHKTILRGANLRVAYLRKADLSEADLSMAKCHIVNFCGANLNKAILMNTDISFSQLVGTTLEYTNLMNCRIYGISAWDLKINDQTNQSNLIITKENEPIITVDNLEVAQFIYLLLNNQKIRQVIDTITSKVVLILGRFTPERKAILDAIREELRKHDYLPVLFDFDKPATRDTEETITTLARLAKFIIADITDPKSIPQELTSIVPALPSVPVQPILQNGYEPWGMFDHIKRYPWVLEIHQYSDWEGLNQSLAGQIIPFVETEIKKIRKEL
jgi:uncharacterized protein YjbI with pentapeptide repeats